MKIRVFEAEFSIAALSEGMIMKFELNFHLLIIFWAGEVVYFVNLGLGINTIVKLSMDVTNLQVILWDESLYLEAL